MSSEEIVIPWELLTEGEHKLFLNFHGALSDGSIVMRTNIASLGLILPSRAPSGNSPESPSPTRADQIQALAEQALALAQSVRQDAEDGLFGQNGGTVTVDDALSGTSTNPVQNKVVKAALDGKGTYSKPSGGIPKSDLASAVQTSLGKADTALQSVPSTYRTAAAQDTIDAGKIDKPGSPASGAFLVYDGSAWVAQTLAVWQGGSY